eukprot:16362582-Heterocapsa_arctica.AAC.1
MKPSMKQYASDVLNLHTDHFQVRHSGKVSLTQRSRLWYTNLASGSKEPEFKPESRIDTGWWPKGKSTSMM